MNGAPDIAIIGSGMGGATLAAALAPSGMSIVILERGHPIPDDAPARDALAVHGVSAFRDGETWIDGEGRRFEPGNYYNVGGNSKFYGAVLLRFREEDFEEREHFGGISPTWPFPYAELAPYYDEAERMYAVRGAMGEDPTEPPRETDYPHPPVPDEPAIAAVRERLARVGLHPFSLPLGVDLDRWLAAGATGWDGYPDTRCGKMDAETCALARALEHPNVELVTGARVQRLETDARGRIARLVYERQGERREMTPGSVAVAAGAVQSAALLLRSKVGNRRDRVGRCFMNHNASALIAIDPRFCNDAIYQKTFGINDWYRSDDGDPDGPPLGNVQLLGRVVPDILRAQVPSLPRPLARWVSGHAVDLYAISEDLPDPESRVALTPDGDIQFRWRRSNMEAHRRLVRNMKRALRRAGFPLTLSRLFDGRVPSHQCGTLRIGDDPASSVADPTGRVWDHPNLWVADASALPTSAAVNPSLTVVALSLRLARTITKESA